MRLGPVFADELSDLEFAQLLYDVGPDEHRDQQRGERRKDSAKRQIAKDPEGVKHRVQLLVKQPVKQENSNAGSDEFSLILLGVIGGRTQVDHPRIWGVNGKWVRFCIRPENVPS